jgi:HlyD family secretion protein
MMKKLFTLKVFIFLLTFLLSTTIGGCGSMAQNTTPTEMPEFESIDPVISASAKLVPGKQATLSFMTGGKDLKIYYETGDFVEKDQILAKINQDDIEFAIDQSEFNQKRAQLALEQLMELPTKESVAAAKVLLSNAEANYDRLDRAGVNEIELAAAQDQLDSAKLSLESIESGATVIQLKNAQLELDLANLALKQALLSRENAEIKMPFDGYLVEIYLHDQEYAPPAQPILLVADLSEMKVETTDLSEVDVVRIKTGDSAIISFDAIPDQTFLGRVEKIANKATPGAAVNFSVFIQLEEVPLNLGWGMTAFVEFKAKEP